MVDKACLRVNRSTEHCGSTSRVFDPRNFRTMILLFKLPEPFQGGAKRPIKHDEDLL